MMEKVYIYKRNQGGTKTFFSKKEKVLHNKAQFKWCDIAKNKFYSVVWYCTLARLLAILATFYRE